MLIPWRWRGKEQAETDTDSIVGNVVEHPESSNTVHPFLRDPLLLFILAQDSAKKECSICINTSTEAEW